MKIEPGFTKIAVQQASAAYMEIKMKIMSIAIVGLWVIGTNAVCAQTVVETKTAPAPTVKIGNATLAPSTTTIYDQPGKGPNGETIPGNQNGSSTTSSHGVTLTIPLPGGTGKK